VSPATAADVISWTLVLMTVLLALSMIAIARAEPWAPSSPEPESPGEPEPAGDLPAAPLPRRVAGESGWVAGVGASELTYLPDFIGRPRA
jgi:hypothetical protein